MPRTNYFEAPMSGPEVENTLLVNIPAEYIPVTLSALESRKNRVFWKTDIDYANGLQGILTAQWGLLMNTGQEIVNALDRLYRLHDNALNGTAYQEADGEISPPIPAAPPAAYPTAAAALRAQVRRLWQLGENAHTGEVFALPAIADTDALTAEGAWAARLLRLQGTRDAGWFRPDVPVTLKDLLEANRINSEGDKTTIRNATSTLADTVTAGGSIADAIGDFLTAAADAGTDGGVIAIQLATSAALLAQLQRINVALNGNPAVLLDTPSMLFALRGDELITSENNILSRIKAAQAADALVLSAIATNTGNTAARLGPLVGGLTANEQLNAVRLAVRSLAGLEAAGSIAQGSALRVMVDLLECICIGVTGTPVGYTYPPAESVACANLQTLVLQTDVTFGADGQYAGPLVWSEVNGSAGVERLTRSIGDLIVTNVGPRELCFSLVWPEGENPSVGIGGTITPIRLIDEGVASRPTINYNGGTTQNLGSFWQDDNADNELIGYYMALSVLPGTAPAYPARIYVHAGAVG